MTDIENMTTKQIIDAVESAARLQHPQRAMRITLECGHIKLGAWNMCVMGIGAFSGCALCDDVVRLVVNMEETGVLWEKNMAMAKVRP